MPSKDTVPFRLTKKTYEEILKIRRTMSKELGVDECDITQKQAEIALRIKAINGKILMKDLNDILLGKIK